MPNSYKNLHIIDRNSYPYIFEQDVDIPLNTYTTGLVRANVYRPKDSDSQKYPVLVTYGPYGKDAPYELFRKPSFDEVNPEHKSEQSAWETPDPKYWTERGYAIVRADERGAGQSPGVLDTLSKGMTDGFFDVVEWAARQSWSSGKVGLTGVSYYAGSQWFVAARKPKGLAAIIPWEGMSDFYADAWRPGGILSNKFIDFAWYLQIFPNQYGRPRKDKVFKPTLEGELSEEELKANLRDQTVDTVKHKYRDEEYYVAKECRLEDIDVPLLSVANLGGLSLHLRGNVQGFVRAGSKLKYLRFIAGRHDLPYYYKEEVEVQKSFLDAFLKGEDRVGWATPGKVAPISVLLREGDVGYNNSESEKAFQRRDEPGWPLPNTQYPRYYLTSTREMVYAASAPAQQEATITYKAMDESPAGNVTFTTPPFTKRAEFTGHIVAHLNIGLPADSSASDIDLFLGLHHLAPGDGHEIFYTGAIGNPEPVCRGWLRASMRKVDESNPKHREYLPHREYLSTDVQMLKPSVTYAVDVELWPTNVVVSPGGRLALTVSGADLPGTDLFKHEHPEDRAPRLFEGNNEIKFGVGNSNYLMLPFIPGQDSNL